ncbi:DUF4258 domain-containing protein [Spirosoma foliorum]|uniref:DUF4258 domain-containing protein n=1 Tax=Spirosoma foliorum TaxID=2710596 RepID=A0A7G5GU02_9BACT|nr:DUF4258 domain-containing protein [Spirosoma foliorum]QMW02344.1 DUF4258 domain-containing protein [Spirosoma foliorum]
MAKFELSKHALEQIELRNLTLEMVDSVLSAPDSIFEEGDGQKIYQGVVERDTKDYLLRIFVNGTKTPNLVKTVYLTSKIKKYE